MKLGGAHAPAPAWPLLCVGRKARALLCFRPCFICGSLRGAPDRRARGRRLPEGAPGAPAAPPGTAAPRRDPRRAPARGSVGGHVGACKAGLWVGEASLRAANSCEKQRKAECQLGEFPGEKAAGA